MNVNFIRSDGIYAKIMKAPLDKKEDIYRYHSNCYWHFHRYINSYSFNICIFLIPISANMNYSI